MMRAVASLVSRGPEYLVVWSQRFQNWSLPGGKLEPFEAEKGSPVTWLTRDELVAQSPYREFYSCMFVTLEGKH